MILYSWINHVEDSSSTSGWVFLLGGGAISWASNKQTCIIGSTMESEFVALVAACKEAKWLRNLIHEILIWPKPIAPIFIHYDSDATLAKAYSQIYNGKSRHLEIKFESLVIVYNYPEGIKTFYMKLNDEKKTTTALDVLMQKVGFSPEFVKVLKDYMAGNDCTSFLYPRRQFTYFEKNVGMSGLVMPPERKHASIPSSSDDKISNLDLGIPLHLQTSDINSNTIISVKLTRTENYRVWVAAIKLAINTRNKTGFLDETCLKSTYANSAPLSNQWEICNSIVLSWLLNSVSRELFLGQIFSDNAFEVWAELKETYDKLDGSITFILLQKIHNFKQGELTVSKYYLKLNSLWREFDIMTKLPKCSCATRDDVSKHNQLIKLMQFLMGLNDVFQPIKSSLLARVTLPDVKDAFAIISREESHRGIASSSSGSVTKPQVSSFVAKSNSWNNSRNKKINNNKKIGNSTNNRGPNPNLHCTNCGKVGHTIDRCFDIIGYPPRHNKNTGPKSNGPRTFNANSVSSSSEKGNVQANMVGRGHPNGALAKIKYVGNLNLSNKIVLFAVLAWSSPDQAVDMFHQDLNFTKDSYVSPYDICHKAKQTREPFPLSDHQTTYIGELIHLDLWGPYKDEVYDHFVNYINMTLNQFNCSIKTVRSDNGTGFINNKMNVLFNSLGIIHQTTCAYTPQQNRIAERKRRHLLNVARSLLYQSGLPLSKWTECVLTFAYLINRLPSSVLNGKSPFELVYGFKPKLSHLRSFGYLCFSSILNSFDKFSPKSEKCVLIGYSATKKAYKVYGLESKHSDFQSPLSPNDDGIFFQAPNDEGSAQPCSSSADNSEVNLATSMGDNSSSEGNVPSNSSPLSQSDLPGNSNQGLPDLRRLNSTNYCFSTTLNNSTEPTTHSKAIKNPNWIEAMNNEIEALNRNDTWTICDLPPMRKAVGSKWLWKIKYKSTGEIERYKARVVAKGFSQREGFDYLETFSLVVQMSTVKWMLNVAICNNWDLFQLEINNAFLYGDLIEDVYMTLSPGFDNDKSKYKYDYSLFIKKSDNVFIMLLVYVDDIVITENDVSEINKFKMFLKSKFQIKDLGKFKYFLGIEVLDNKDGICLSQRKYCLDLLHEYGLLAGKPVETPLTENTTLNHIESNADPLLSNIAYVVHCLSQFMHSSFNSHLDAAMRVLRYLKSSPGNGIQINRNGNLKLRAFADFEWARCPTTKKSVSSTEAEYRSMAFATCEVIWLSNLLSDMGVTGLLHVVMYCDNSSALQIAANPIFHEKSKHFEIDVHLVREKVASGVIKTEKIYSSQQTADILTKGLGFDQHKELCKKLGMLDMFSLNKT
ncbi:putative RNA-directed DNA polymerase [Tanacetum coccineum]